MVLCYHAPATGPTPLPMPTAPFSPTDRALNAVLALTSESALVTWLTAPFPGQDRAHRATWIGPARHLASVLARAWVERRDHHPLTVDCLESVAATAGVVALADTCPDVTRLSLYNYLRTLGIHGDEAHVRACLTHEIHPQRHHDQTVGVIAHALERTPGHEHGWEAPYLAHYHNHLWSQLLSRPIAPTPRRRL